MRTISRAIRQVPTWLFLLQVIPLTLYAPIELSRVIYVTAFCNTIINRGDIPSWNFILEMTFLWVAFALGWLEVYVRIKPK